MSIAKRKQAHAPADGRRARAGESRRRIAEAMLDLARQGMIDPSAEDVAAHAGVGRRTVFRLFDDMEGLYSEIHDLMLARIKPIAEAPLDGSDWRTRLNQLIERRARAFEEILPVRDAGDLRRHRSAFLQRQHAELNEMLRDIVLFVLPKTLARDKVLVEALDVALSIEAWRRLRRDQNLTVKSAIAVLQRTAAALCSA